MTSISKKVPLLQEVKKALKRVNSRGCLYGADTDDQVIGRYFVDFFWQMPPLSDLTIDQLITYCRDHHISSIIPTRDGELVYFADYRDQLEKNDISVMVSSSLAITTTLDKLTFYQYAFANHVPAIKTELCLDKIKVERFVVKERLGSGSNQLGINLEREEASVFSQKLKNPIFQPYYSGKEFSIDMYVNHSNEVVGTIVRSRDYIEHGEAQITTVVDHPQLTQASIHLAKQFDFYGHVVLQAIESQGGTFHFIECNARFGGASTLSVAAGLDSFYWFLQEVCEGKYISAAQFSKSKKSLRLVRYPQDLIITKGEIER